MCGKTKSMRKRLGRYCGPRDGQAMIEFTMVAVMVLMMVTIMAVLLYTFREHSSRTLALAAYEYP